eukprot:g5763.t1
MSESKSPWPSSSTKKRATNINNQSPPPSPQVSQQQATLLSSPPVRYYNNDINNSQVRTAKRTNFKAVPNRNSARKKKSSSRRNRNSTLNRKTIGSGVNEGMGIVAKTEVHLYQKKIRQQQALEPEGTFKPKITSYSANLRRNVPIHERLFAEGKKRLIRKATEQRKAATYDRNDGRRLFHPKVTNPSPAAQLAINEAKGSPLAKNVSIAAGQRLYREAELSRARKRQKEAMHNITLEMRRVESKMTPKSRDLARRRLERNLQSVFIMLNKSSSGFLTFEEISDGMRETDIVLPTPSIENEDGEIVDEIDDDWSMIAPDVRMWDLLDVEGAGKIDLIQFLGVVAPVVDAAPSMWSLRDMEAPLTATQLILVYADGWLKWLSRDGGPHGHHQSSNDRRRWREGVTKSAIPSRSNIEEDHVQDSRYHVVHSEDVSECTFQPKINERSRYLDRKRVKKIIKKITNVVINNDDGGGGDISLSDIDIDETQISRQDLMLHQDHKRRQSLKVKQLLKEVEEMEECTFHPTTSHSSRTIQQSRRTAQESKLNSMDREMKMLEDEYPDAENQYYRAKKTEVFENLYRNALETRIKWKHPSIKTTEEKEIEQHCTFKPDINNLNTAQSKIISRINRGVAETNVKNMNLEERGIDDALDDLGSRLPWESALNAQKRSPTENRKLTKKSIRSSMILSDPLKVDTSNNYNTVPKRVDTSKVWGYDKHAERIRKARSDKQLREMELEMMGRVKPGKFEESLRVSHSQKHDIHAQRFAASTESFKNKKKKVNDNIIKTPLKQDNIPSNANNINLIDSLLMKNSDISAVYNAEPDLVMNVNIAKGEFDTINIYHGDDAGVLASNFAALHQLDFKKQGKLRELIVRNMREHNIFTG